MEAASLTATSVALAGRPTTLILRPGILATFGVATAEVVVTGV
jgi:hypothetical protein